MIIARLRTAECYRPVYLYRLMLGVQMVKGQKEKKKNQNDSRNTPCTDCTARRMYVRMVERKKKFEKKY